MSKLTDAAIFNEFDKFNLNPANYKILEFARAVESLVLQSQAPSHELTHENGIPFSRREMYDLLVTKNMGISELEKTVSAHVRNDWKESMLDECVITHTVFYEDDPRKTLLSLIHWHIGVALDPAVSQVAAQVRDAALEEAAKVCESGRYMCIDPWRTHSAQELCDAERNGAKRLAKAIRCLQSQLSEVEK